MRIEFNLPKKQGVYRRFSVDADDVTAVEEQIDLPDPEGGQFSATTLHLSNGSVHLVAHSYLNVIFMISAATGSEHHLGGPG